MLLMGWGFPNTPSTPPPTKGLSSTTVNFEFSNSGFGKIAKQEDQVRKKSHCT
jgi:hypothetical protein